MSQPIEQQTAGPAVWTEPESLTGNFLAETLGKRCTRFLQKKTARLSEAPAGHFSRGFDTSQVGIAAMRTCARTSWDGYKLRTRNKTVAELVRVQKPIRILTNPATWTGFVGRSKYGATGSRQLSGALNPKANSPEEIRVG